MIRMSKNLMLNCLRKTQLYKKSSFFTINNYFHNILYASLKSSKLDRYSIKGS